MEELPILPQIAKDNDCPGLWVAGLALVTRCPSQWPLAMSTLSVYPGKKGNTKECSNCCTTALISHTSKVMLKILQARLQQSTVCEPWTSRCSSCKPEEPEEPEIKLSTSVGSSKKQEFQKYIYFCFIDYAKAFDSVDHNKLWKILKEMGIPDHLTCLLRNLYSGQEETVRTGHGTTDWFQIGKIVCQGNILSPC